MADTGDAALTRACPRPRAAARTGGTPADPAQAGLPGLGGFTAPNKNTPPGPASPAPPPGTPGCAAGASCGGHPTAGGGRRRSRSPGRRRLLAPPRARRLPRGTRPRRRRRDVASALPRVGGALAEGAVPVAEGVGGLALEGVGGLADGTVVLSPAGAGLAVVAGAVIADTAHRFSRAWDNPDPASTTHAPPTSAAPPLGGATHPYPQPGIAGARPAYRPPA